MALREFCEETGFSKRSELEKSFERPNSKPSYFSRQGGNVCLIEYVIEIPWEISGDSNFSDKHLTKDKENLWRNFPNSHWAELSSKEWITKEKFFQIELKERLPSG